MKKLFITTLLLLLAGSCLAEMLSVTHLPAELRDRPMVSGSKIIQKLDRYAPLEVLESSSDYYKVKSSEGKIGYIHRSLTGKIEGVIVTASICNARSGPGTEFPIVFKAKKGDNFKVVSHQQDWVEIKALQGETGWIRQDLLSGE